MLSGAATLVLPGLVQGRSLCYAVAVFPEDDFRIGRKSEKPFDSLPNAILVSNAYLLFARLWVSGNRRCSGLPDLNIASSINPRPDTQNVLATSDT